jgi:hypothetical protein
VFRAFIPEPSLTMLLAASADCRRLESSGSLAYKSAIRSSVSLSAAGNCDGAHEFTRASPRKTSGTFCATATAISSVLRVRASGKDGNMRLSQPS